MSSKSETGSEISSDVKRPEEIPEDEQPEKVVEEVSYISTGDRKAVRKNRIIDEEEPLIDTTEALPLRSKKIEREKRKLAKKQKKTAQRPPVTNLLDLPPELLQEVFGHLRALDILRLSQVSRPLHAFIREQENAIARDIIRTRYWILSKCFSLPVAFADVDPSAKPALLSHKRQDMLQIHKKPYQHVKGIDSHAVCTCMSCVFAWNNLCLILDLAHWQKNLNEREPIPMIPRGTSPSWNSFLLEKHATIVEKAMTSKLTYAMILQKHLATTISTITRTIRGKKTLHPKRLYHLTPPEAAKETDEFLERSGPPSYEFPWHRDNYYGLEAYVPNRKWSREQERWMYYAESLHERDLAWVKEKFSPGEGERVVVRDGNKMVPLAEFVQGNRKQQEGVREVISGRLVEK